MKFGRRLDNRRRVYFASQLKTARAVVLRDAECFEEHIFTMERLGSYLGNFHGDLKKYQPYLEGLADKSPLSIEAEAVCPELHIGFGALYEEVRLGRNDAMHQGAIARHLARYAQELALIMEDALMSGAKTVREFMIRDPICAELWHPLSAIRRTMLLNAFSFLPYQTQTGTWQLLSDSSLVRFMRASSTNRRKRMLMSLQDALNEGLQPTKPVVSQLNEPIERLAAAMRNIPSLVFDKQDRLVGFITAFDLL